MVSMKTKADAVGEIGRLLNALADKFENDGDAERDYLTAHCAAHLERPIREIPTLGVHLLAAIADGAVNIVGLAAASGQLKGTVSKNVQRLVEAGLVQRARFPATARRFGSASPRTGRTRARTPPDARRDGSGTGGISYCATPRPSWRP